MKRFAALLCAVLMLVPVHLQAQTPGVRTHDGFYLRFLAGGGPGSLTLKQVDGTEIEFSSDVGGGFHFQIGAAVAENLILFGDIGGFTLTEPDVDAGGAAVSGDNLDVTASGFGGGLTYYFMPANIFVSGSVLASMNSLTVQGQDFESELGPSVFVSAGKEWWVGNSWGLGVAVFAEMGWTKDKEDAFGNQADMNTRIFGVAFSATLN